MDIIIKLSWLAENSDITYFVNGDFIGKNDAGINALITMLSKQVEIKKLIIKYPVRGAVGGKSLRMSFPFYKRYDELLDITKSKGVTIELEQIFDA